MQCPICTETYTSPKALPCQHTFCEGCLHTYIVGIVGHQPKHFPCPVCRNQTSAPASGVPTDLWAEHFPNNLTIVALFDQMSIQKKERPCCQCSRGNVRRTAVGWCEECSESLCKDCCNQHKLNRMSQNHTVVNLVGKSIESATHTVAPKTRLPRQKPLLKRNAKKMAQFSSNTADDTKKRSLSGVSFTEAGDILVVDNNNSKLKLFTTTGQLLHQLQLSHRPWDITVVDRTTVAVTLPDETMIQFISMTDGLSTTHRIGVGLGCYGITCVDDKLAVTCNQYLKHSIHVLSMDGQALQSIRKNCSDLQRWNGITSTPGRSGVPAKLYVTDNNADSVLCYTLDGQCLLQYINSEMNCPLDIAVDVEGNMYVACADTMAIRRISPWSSAGKPV
jgi:hypothetical protein